MSRASKLSRRARKTAKRLRHAARDMKARMGNHAGHFLGDVQRMGAEAAGAVKHRFEDLRETATDYIEQGRRGAHNLEKSMERRVKQRPVLSLLATLGCGMLIGFFFARRKGR